MFVEDDADLVVDCVLAMLDKFANTKVSSKIRSVMSIYWLGPNC
jgi:hypothetical protein